jgi:hypothetical protein
MGNNFFGNFILIMCGKEVVAKFLRKNYNIITNML